MMELRRISFLESISESLFSSFFISSRETFESIRLNFLAMETSSLALEMASSGFKQPLS
jgi:hypothetical protein